MSSTRQPRPRGSLNYTKPALTEAQLLNRWIQRGLIVDDAERATRYLRHIGYYRLSAYVRSFEGTRRDQLRDGTTFDDVLGLYIFDRKLRLRVLDALERVEVAVRAAISDRMSLGYGTHWYENPQLFSRPNDRQRLLDDVDRMVDEQRRRRPERASGDHTFVSALEHYTTRYGTPERPPTWIVFEELSFGGLRNVYESLAETADKHAIADCLGLKAPVLTSWLKSYQRVRNICAHHGRLWNRGLGVYPVLPKSRSIRWLHDPTLFDREQWRRQRLYPVLVSLQTILYTVAPGSLWALRLGELFRQHPAVPLATMGIPRGWLDDPFWPRKPT